MKLIVGLGNPGKKYERTRHNVGFLVVDKLTTDYRLQTTATPKLKADVAKGEIEGKRTLLAKPHTFMNNSGESVKLLLNFYKLKSSDLIVVHDDKDIPLGETRVQQNRGAAGHNGVQSIFDHLGTKDFTRIRIGIAPQSPPFQGGAGGGLPSIADTAAFVLAKFSKEEQKILKTVLSVVADELKRLLK